MAQPTLMERLGTFASELRFEALPREVVEKAGIITLHNLAVGLAGYPAVKALWGPTRRKSGPDAETASLLIEGLKVPAPDAAFANGILIHARAQDDIHMPANSHLGCTVLPAALAVAEAWNRTGAEFVTALAAGYEVAAAVGKVGAERSTPRGFRATAVYGPIGAAAAAATLRGLTPDPVQHAIAIATSLSAGLNQTWVDGSTEWRIQVGQAARNGILAAELAAAGATGAKHAFEGPVGFFQAIVGDRSLAEACGRDLGEARETLAVTFKPYAVCAILQTPVATVLRLRRAHHLDAEQIASVKLYLNPYEAAYPGIDSNGPYHDVGATLMSARFCLSIALNHGEVQLQHLYQFSAPEYERLWPRIAIVPQEGLPPVSCRVEITTTDGRTLADEFIAGPATFNFTAGEEAELVRGLLPEIDTTPDCLERLIDACLRVETLPNVRPLLDLSRRQKEQ